jgi:hypothetical protein
MHRSSGESRCFRAVREVASSNRWGEGRTCTRQGTDERVVRPCGSKARDLVVEALQGLSHTTPLLDEPFDQQLVGPDHPAVGGQRCGTEDGLYTRLNDVGVAPVVFLEESRQAGLTRPLGVLACGPAGENVTEDHRVLVLEPLQDLWDIRLERIGEPIREANLVSHPGAAWLHQPRPGAPGRAWRMPLSHVRRN